MKFEMFPKLINERHENKDENKNEILLKVKNNKDFLSFILD